jgi:hypothetical protein
MLFSINRLTSLAKLSELAEVYDKKSSQWSRVFNWFVDHVLSIDSNTQYLTTGNIGISTYPIWQLLFD